MRTNTISRPARRRELTSYHLRTDPERQGALRIFRVEHEDWVFTDQGTASERTGAAFAGGAS